MINKLINPNAQYLFSELRIFIVKTRYCNPMKREKNEKQNLPVSRPYFLTQFQFFVVNTVADFGLHR